MVVEGEAQLKALSNPERVKILALLIERAGTAKQVGDWVGATRGRAHYHVKALEKAGFVEIVAKIEKGGVLEKYYRAVSRNFYIARGVGEHAGLSGDVREMLSASMLGWRRQQILDVDVEAIAQKVIRDCLDTRRGNVILVRGDFIHADIIKPLNSAIEAVGAHCLVMYNSREKSDFILKWKDHISSVIAIEEPLDYSLNNGSAASGARTGDARRAFLEKLVKSGRRFLFAGVPGYPLEDPVSRELIRSGKRFIYLGYPTPQKAEVMGIDFRDLHDGCWTALDVDYWEIAEQCASLKRVLEAGHTVRVLGPGGTDLTYGIEGREVFLDDGIISGWEVRHGRGWGHLPAGKVIVAPVSGTASGVIFSEVTDYFGVRLSGIRLEFENGEVVSASADENDELLQLVLSEGKGDCRKAAEFNIGTNPNLREPIGYNFWDSKSYGNATFGIGDNRLIGGENDASLNWNFVIVKPSVHVDGKLVLKNGQFVV